MKCQGLFSGKNINFLSSELVQKLVKVNLEIGLIF